jgi:colanic acid/amylovoran biosynthesis glycosyltransferase
LIEPHLLIIPSVPVWLQGNTLIFDRKFYDGMALYAEKWPGKVSCLMSTSTALLPDFGIIKKTDKELPFKCLTIDKTEFIGTEHLKGASLVLASGDAYNQLHISELCRQMKIKCVYVIEYIPETRYQIAALSTNNPLIKLRRFFYIWRHEKKRVDAFQLADGLQSNGTPAYYEYNSFKNNLLYFDTRVDNRHSISLPDLENRLEYLSQGNPLRLAFSGRLIQMKGADHLVTLAKMLKKEALPFSMTIYGTGDLENEMKKSIKEYQLENQVSMPGAVDFYTKLIPDLKKNIDLFISLHRQSDPSCTYLETLSCGVPIVGYNNKAFAGLLDLADIGWGAKLNDLDAIKKFIIHLNKNRLIISQKSRNSLAFSQPHDFERTFNKRVNHLLSILEQ